MMPDLDEPHTAPGRPVAGWNRRTGGLPVIADYRHPDASGRRQAQARLDAELATVRTELQRVDAKSSTLLSLAGVLLGGGLALLAGTGRTVPAAVAAATWIAAGLVGTAVEQLALAIRPNLGGLFGFVRWAKAADGQEILTDLTSPHRDDPLLDRAHELRWLSTALYRKYVAVRRAVTLLVAGLATAAVAAALAMWAR
ncbi:Pycsar system effector family protein [Planosporangium sp. 12N6]|uniref:Pycsar system effector family protein n=1 Tax=Planosporangium spinosum TaxID=3402278 RepID=UPI003CEC4522